MLVTISANDLELTINTFGAEMTSVKKSGREYLWQGDSDIWSGQAPNLFPFIGRLTNNSYSLCGKVYPMGIHGFAAKSEFELVKAKKNSAVFELKSNEETKEKYPFDFVFKVTYTLGSDTVEVSYDVENKSDKTMPFGIGGHPGFKVPISDEEKFDDYYLEFAAPCVPDRVEFTPQVYLSGNTSRYPLINDCRINLTHRLFDDDAIILKNMTRKVTLKSKNGTHGVTVDFPDMPYFGIWHMPKMQAPYVCLEPWSSLPARQDVVEEFNAKSDLIFLKSDETYKNEWSITLF